MHCAEGVVQAVAADPEASWLSFEKPQLTFAKGFGNLTTYFLRTSDRAPPKELMVRLEIEPRIPRFFFEGAGGGGCGGAGGVGVGVGVSGGGSGSLAPFAFTTGSGADVQLPGTTSAKSVDIESTNSSADEA